MLLKHLYIFIILSYFILFILQAVDAALTTLKSSLTDSFQPRQAYDLIRCFLISVMNLDDEKQMMMHLFSHPRLVIVVFFFFFFFFIQFDTCSNTKIGLFFFFLETFF